MKSHSADATDLGLAAFLVGVAATAVAAIAFTVAATLSETEVASGPDATDELLRDPRNADRLLGAIDSLRRGEWESHPLATRPPVAA